MTKVEWVGGALDGCVDDIERPTNVWIGPDPVAPTSRVIVYGLHTASESRVIYRFDQKLTERANTYPGP